MGWDGMGWNRKGLESLTFLALVSPHLTSPHPTPPQQLPLRRRALGTHARLDLRNGRVVAALLVARGRVFRSGVQCLCFRRLGWQGEGGGG